MRQRKGTKVDQIVFYTVLVIAALAVGVAGLMAYYRVAGDLEVCRIYYPEMSRAACYFSSKTVRTPSSR